MGPGFLILRRDPLTAEQIDDLNAWLHTFTQDRETSRTATGEPNGWAFRIADASVLGPLESRFIGEIGISFETLMHTWDGDEEEQLMLRLGFWPRYAISIYAMSKTFSTGRATSSLILRLMERYGGYLDCCLRERVADRRVFEKEHRPIRSETPGKEYTIRYWAPDPRYDFFFSCWWAKSVMDSERLRWWLSHPGSALPGFRLE